MKIEGEVLKTDKTKGPGKVEDRKNAIILTRKLLSCVAVLM